MGSSPPSPPPIPPEFRAAFQAAAGPDGVLPFSRFVELALYHPTVGYYRRDRPRVGTGKGTDFFTASSTQPVFGELVVAACVKLLGRRPPHEHLFVEIGAEPGQSVLEGIGHPFAGVRTLRLGDALTLTGNCVVFSNELFDAQPFVRSVRRDGRWQEIGVRLADDRLVEIEWPMDANETAADGTFFDRPLGAAQLARTIAAQPWCGLFVAIDYGKTLTELLENTPQGTARAYHRHRQSNDLLAHPGEQDLTCHVCWDWIVAALVEQKFTTPTLEFQETFLLRHAGPAIEAISGQEAARLSRRKLALLQLLHPSQLGQKFQVLHGLR